MTLVALTCFAAAPAWADNYTPQEVGYAWYDTSNGINVNLRDDDAQSVDIGFLFTFYDRTQTIAQISSNGYLRLDGGSATPYSNRPIPNTGNPNNYIAPFWDDLNPSQGGTIRYDLQGAPGNRRFVVEWNNVPFYNNNSQRATFQVVLFEGSNYMMFNLQSTGRQCGGCTHTIGIENRAGNDGTQIDYSDRAINRRSWVIRGPIQPPVSQSCGSDGTYFCNTLQYGYDTLTDEGGVNTLYQGPRAYSLRGCDDTSTAVNLPFNFRFYNTNYNQMHVSTNGQVAFGSNSGLTRYVPDTIPNTTDPDNYLAPGWTDLLPCRAGRVMWAVRGTAPNRRIVVEWYQIPNYWDYTKITTMQMVMYEGGDVIDYHIQRIEAPPNIAYTTGIENNNGTGGIQILRGFNTLLTRSYRLTRNPLAACNAAQLGQSCTYTGAGDPLGNAAACRTGITTCVNGAVTCSRQNFPFAEVCDAADNDCDGTIDDGVGNTYYRDADGDSWGSSQTLRACSLPRGYATRGGDCRDDKPAINPGANEICDYIDNNCRNGVDENLRTTHYWDGDRDTWGDPGNAGSQCPGNTQDARWVTRASDCNPSNGSVYPGAPEICDGIDNNCNGDIDEGGLTRYYRDFDGDGYGNPNNSREACSQPRGFVTDRTDCDDTNRSRNPGADEVCDNIDNDCNNLVDDDPSDVGQSCNPGVPGACSQDSTSACVDGNVVCPPSEPDGYGQVSQVAVPAGLLDRQSGLVGTSWKLITSNGQYMFNLAYSRNNGGYNGYTVRVFDPVDGFRLVKEFQVGGSSLYIDGISAKGNMLYAVQWANANGARVVGINWQTETIVNTTTHNQGTTQSIEGQYDWINDRFWMGALQNGARIYEHDGSGISAANLIRQFVPQGYPHAGSGTVAADGRFLYIKRWGGYVGSNELVRIGSGYGGTVRGANYGTVANVSTTLATTYHPDGYIYIGGSGSYALQRVKVTDAQFEICDGNDNDCDGQVDEEFPTVGQACDGGVGQCGDVGRVVCSDSGYAAVCDAIPGDPVQGYGDISYANLPARSLERSTGTTIDGNRLITSNGQYIFNLAYGRNGGTYNGYTVRIYDPLNNFAVVKTFQVGSSSLYIDGISAKGDMLYAIEWWGGHRVVEINWRTERIIRTVTHDQPNTRAIEGQYDWANDVFWLGALDNAARIYEHDGSGMTTASRTAMFSPQGYGHSGSGTVAADGQFLYIKRWGGYPGSNELVRIGSGYGGTERGVNYGTVANVSPTLTTTYHPDGYIYIGGGDPTRFQRVRVTPPQMELCDGIDNDCDGQIDEDFPTLGQDCSEGVGACASEGTVVCSANGVAAVCTANPGRPTAEICDGIDNDCDGSTDEELRRACNTVCGNGTEFCQAGAWVGCDAQQPIAELCDGLDNDCNGFIDDAEECGCQYFPEDNGINPSLEWAWDSSSTNVQSSFSHVMMTPVVGHLNDDNGDGQINADDIPEVLFVGTTTNYNAGGYLRALNGEDGSERWVYTARRVYGAASPAVGDLDNDGTPEVVAYAWRDASQGAPNNAGLVALDNNGNEIWNNLDVNRDRTRVMGSPAIANVRRDVPGNEVVACHWLVSANGTTLWDNSSGTQNRFCSPAVADVDDDGEMEILIGNRAYNHDGTTLWSNNTITGAAPAIADFNGDGVPEMVVVNRRLFIVNARTGAILASQNIAGGGTGGAPNIDDFDGDGVPEIGVAGANAYAVYEYNGPNSISVLWQRTTQDTSSNITGSSVFDFNGDGNAEVVYNDEYYLRVYDGRDGTILFEERNGSGTLVEYPVIVDVDRDGNAEIIVGRNNIGNRSSGLSPNVGVRVYGDTEDNWVGTRTFWNQFAYHVTNMNDDFSVPATEPNSWEGQAPNSYRSNFQGAISAFAAPDLVIGAEVDVTLGSDNGVWPGTDVPFCPAFVSADIQVCNQGDVDVLAGTSVGIYLGNPTNGGELVATATTTERLAPDECVEVTIAFVSPIDGERDVWLWLDNEEDENECDEDNNIVFIGNYDLNGVEEEICDGIDNDCDQVIDQITRPCNGCPGRDQLCEDGEWLECRGDEVCDGLDNDCDGDTDESPEACGSGRACAEAPNGDFVCFEAQTVPDCGAGCPIGQVCNAAEGACVPYCADDVGCPVGQTCGPDAVCVDAAEQHTSLDQAWQETEGDSDQRGGDFRAGSSCSASFSSGSGALGSFGALMLLGFGAVLIRRRRR